MLDFLFKKEVSCAESLNDFYTKLREMYPSETISQERKDYFEEILNQYGYLPYPHLKALEELSNAEVLFALEFKWKNEGVFKNGIFDFSKTSVLARNGINNSFWIQKEGHNIKLINLAGLGNGNISSQNGLFFDWLRQLLILPTGNTDLGILNTTMYLIPFHPRDFGCAYLPTASCVSPSLEDKEILAKTGLNADEQVKMFIKMTQLAGHPVIYDILPQTGRFSKVVLSNPECARWYDINALTEELFKQFDSIKEELRTEYSLEDIEIVSGIVKKSLLGECYGDLSEHYQSIFDKFEEKLKDTKIFLSNSMLEKSIQDKLHKKVQNIISRITGISSGKKLSEKEITNQDEIVQILIQEGMWTAPGGAWCSAKVPVFDKMSEGASFPVFKHYNYNDEDVSHCANLDCQTPYYFTCLENGKYNDNVIKFFIEYIKNLQAEFNFDGFRIDHTDHVADSISEDNGIPISYRIPQKVLEMLNSAMKSSVSYFAIIAEYMLGEKLYKEYHQDMKFDLLWGDDTILQSSKTPEVIAEDNLYLSNYNIGSKSDNLLSVLKTYNNQDGEFREINKYPAQLGREGALFKWFKYKFLPGGKYAQRPILYIDGDESYTDIGIEATINSEIAMKRNNDYDFYAKFDAIDRFVKNNIVINCGEANIIRQDDDGFSAWLIQKEGVKNSILVVANYNSPVEHYCIENEDNLDAEVKEGLEVFDKTIELSCDYSIVSEYRFDGTDYIEEKFVSATNNLTFSKLMPSEFKFYTVLK